MCTKQASTTSNNTHQNPQWAKLYHAIIAAAVRLWRHRRPSACVRVSGGHFISSSAFNSDIVFFPITAAFETFVDQPNRTVAV